MKHFSYSDILNLDKYVRINLINKINGFKSANLIGTVNKAGQTNLAIFSSVIHMGSNPPLLGFVTRPTTVDRHTYKNIKETGLYTINAVTADMVERAHQTSAKYTDEQSEFELCGFKESYLDNFIAPFIEESPIKVGLSFVEEHDIKANGTILVVGKIESLSVPDNALGNDGDLDLEEINTVTIGGLDTYYKPEKIARYSFARPDEPLNKIK